ncbi:MAG TPA: response regulator, partial [Candidatus Udaeobacter sp.]|nr:response regulator [Candidatus Udaeobacter sp.]
MRTILVVDDDPWVRVLARDVLAGEGYRVLEASDGQDAIRVAAEHPGPIHLLLTDVVMPQMSGPELAKRLVRSRPETKILCMSGYT